MRRRLPEGSRALVTGARGFTGRHLVEALVAERTDVTPDFVFHLSSLADGRRNLDLVLPTFQAETLAAVNVLTTVAEAGHGRVLLPVSLEEPAAGEAPSSPYAAAKTATHLYARMFAALYRVPVMMARVFMAYGRRPGPARRFLEAQAGSEHAPNGSLKRNHHASLALLQAVQNGTSAGVLTLGLRPLGVDAPEESLSDCSPCFPSCSGLAASNHPPPHRLLPGARRDDRRGRPKSTIANVDLFVKQYIHDLLPVQPVPPRF